MFDHGLREFVDVLDADSNEEAGASAARVLLARRELPTALVAFNDRCAAGAQDVLIRAGVRIPKDLSLVGFDDSSIAALSYRRLTSVHQDFTRIAAVATQRAIDRMELPEVVARLPLLPVTLTIRNTTAPPRNPTC
jgi:DNA-binding LacI/PurR family transcriptional regulator